MPAKAAAGEKYLDGLQISFLAGHKNAIGYNPRRPDLFRVLPGQASRISHRRVEVTATRKITGGFRN